MTIDGNTTGESSTTVGGPPTYTSYESKFEDDHSAVLVNEINRNRIRTFSSISEASQDSGAALLPEVSFAQIGLSDLINLHMGSPSGSGGRENQPLLGHYRNNENEVINHWQGTLI